VKSAAIMHLRRLLPALLLACGPAAPSPQSDESSSSPDVSAGSTSSSSSAPTTTAADATTAPTPTTSSTTAVDPSTSAGTTDAAEATFLLPSDLICLTAHGARCSPGGCDNWAQDCPPGEKCSAYAFGGGSSWDSLKCVPVMENPAQPGDECFVEGNGVSGVDNCDLGSYCWDVDEENVGACVALCKGNPEAASCDDPTKACAIYNEGVLNLCLDACDPLAQDCPTTDDLCIGNPSGDGFLCVIDASGEEGQQHDPCEYANSCDPGLLCLNATAANECDPNASGCCEPFCDLTDPNADMDCGGVGQVCNPYYEAGTAPPGQENIGYCALPAP
jgi:hypothetical protein